jgi:hypothetical protein
VGRTRTYSTHRAKKPPQPYRIGIQCRKDVFSSTLTLVLQFTGAQGLCERSPEAIEPSIGHLQNTADIGWLSSIKKQVGFHRVAVDAVLALQQLERDQRIKEVTS